MLRLRLLPVGIWLIAGAVVATAVLTARSMRFNPLGVLTSVMSQLLVVLAGFIVVSLVYALRRKGTAWAHALCATTAALCSGVLAVALAKTPFGLNGLNADQSFRSADMTRFSLTAAPVDFGYPGHGSFIPPLWFWVSGRAAAVLGMDGWEAMKWAQIATAFLVPLAGFVFWRRVAGTGPGALATVLGVLAVPDPIKGDEWLSLVIMLPWWLDAFADVRAVGIRRWPAWAHGLVAGLMLSLYTAFFLPAAVATVGISIWYIWKETWRPFFLRCLIIVAVGLIVWGWVWVPAMYERLTGPPFELFQCFGSVTPVPYRNPSNSAWRALWPYAA